jgi:Fe-S-cluster containining protein
MELPAEYQRHLQIANGKRKENKSFLDRLKKLRPNDLDVVTNEFHDKAFEKIDCLKCANCCKTTGPLLKYKDIQTLSLEKKIRQAEFTEKYLRVDEDNDWVFKKMPCPFLGSDNYCSVYSARPNACHEYPHTQQRNILEKLPITFLNSMICPAVAIVVENLKDHYKK